MRWSRVGGRGNGNQGNPPSRERERGKNPPLLPLQKPSPNQGGVSGTVHAAFSRLSSLTLFLLDFDGDGESGGPGKKGDGGWRGGGGERGLLLSGPPPPLSILSFSGGRAPPSPPLFLILSGKQLLLERERENQGGGESGVFLGFPPEYLVRRQKVRTGGTQLYFRGGTTLQDNAGKEKKHRVEVRKRTPPPPHFLFPPTF